MRKRFQASTAVLLFLFVVSGCGAAQDLGKALDNKAETNAPVAVVDSEIKATVKSNVIIDGSRSYDPNDLSLTHEWTLADIPQGSLATLGTTASPVTSFFADKGGYYTVVLKVTNSASTSSVVVTSRINVVGTGNNHPPVAIVTVTASEDVAVLDGSGSYDIDGSALAYNWAIINAPSGSSLTSTTSPITPLRGIPARNM